MIPIVILTILLIATGIAFLSSVLAGFIPSTTSKNTKNTKIKKLISNYLPSGGHLDPNQSIQSQDRSYILKNEGDRLVLIGPDGEVVKEWTSDGDKPFTLSVSDNGTVSYGETIINQGTTEEDKYNLEITNDGNLELSNSSDSEIIGLKWTQIGDDIIDDEALWNWRLSLSSDGKILSTDYYNENYRTNDDDTTAKIEIYNNEDGNSWNKLRSYNNSWKKSIIYNTSTKMYSLSKDCKSVAIVDYYDKDYTDKIFNQRIRVYNYNDNDDSWNKIGNDIDIDNTLDDNYDYNPEDNILDFSLNDNGKTISVYYKYKNSENSYTLVKVYDYVDNNPAEGGKWVQLGDDIINGGANTYGKIVLSGDGRTFAVIFKSDRINRFVRLYQYTDKWNRLGNDIENIHLAYDLPYSIKNEISLSSSGNVVAVSKNNYINIYKYGEDGNWNKLGNDIYGKLASSDYGYIVSLSSDGANVAINALKTVVDSEYPYDVICHSSVYQYKETYNSWTQIGNDIDIQWKFNGQDYYQSISLSENGKTIAIKNFNENKNNIKVYKLI